MNLEKYFYKLPEELIAQNPSSPKDSCKLMILQSNNNKNEIQHKIFKDILNEFSFGDVLVLNDTKVLHAKLLGRKETGSNAEITLLKHIGGLDYESKIKTKNPLVGNKILIRSKNRKLFYTTIMLQKNIDTFVVRLSSKEILHQGMLPKPPYIHHDVTDKEYQTVFAKEQKDKGSLAAPTAGLHFTKELLAKIKKKGVKIVYVTLHVSYGTFKNIESINNYIMDPEYFEISKSTANIINKRTGKLFVVGTTTLKALETSSKEGTIIPFRGESTLFIYPPFQFNSGTDCLVTNFHLPKSTLLLLTCAFGGEKRILNAYDVAVKEKYKFFSLGDSMMIYR